MAEIHVIRIGVNEDIIEGIKTFMHEKQWEKACILNAIGAVKELVFAVPSGMTVPPNLIQYPFEGPGELVSFVGEVMKLEAMDPILKTVYKCSGEYFIHIHASAAIGPAVVYGGGFRAGKAFMGLSIFITRL